MNQSGLLKFDSLEEIVDEESSSYTIVTMPDSGDIVGIVVVL